MSWLPLVPLTKRCCHLKILDTAAEVSCNPQITLQYPQLWINCKPRVQLVCTFIKENTLKQVGMTFTTHRGFVSSCYFLPSLIIYSSKQPHFILMCVFFINFLFVHHLFSMLRQHSCLYPVEYSKVNTQATEYPWTGILSNLLWYIQSQHCFCFLVFLSSWCFRSSCRVC